MKALAFVVTSRSLHRIRVERASYCEFQSDDGYTADYSGKLSDVGRETLPARLRRATLCYVWLNTAAMKGARVTAAVVSY